MNIMNYKNYRFLTLEEMEERFEKDEHGSFSCGRILFVKNMYHLLGKEINEVDAEFILNDHIVTLYKLTSDINGDLKWIFSPEMITNEPLHTPNLEQSVKQLKEAAEKLNLKVSITFE